MTILEIKKAKDDILKKYILDLRSELMNSRFKISTTTEFKNTARLRVIKRQIARVKTILHERKIKI